MNRERRMELFVQTGKGIPLTLKSGLCRRRGQDEKEKKH